MSLFVTGTNTDVGKTYITRLIIEGLRQQGLDAVGYKPVSCGGLEDTEILAQVSGGLDADVVNPVQLLNAVAPHVACQLENREIDPKQLIEGYEKLAAKHDVVLVEGAGGWEVPLRSDYSMSDLAAELGLPVLLVAANQLGAINHSLLSVNAIRSKGLECRCIVLNQLEDELDTAMITNKTVIGELSGVALLEHVIHGQDFINDEVLACARGQILSV
ncbi:MAG: dethiobiotin synthase [Luteolibacter sp.]|jgi:dethiobiotin synthetase